MSYESSSGRGLLSNFPLPRQAESLSFRATGNRLVVWLEGQVWNLRTGNERDWCPNRLHRAPPSIRTAFRPVHQAFQDRRGPGLGAGGLLHYPARSG